MNPSSPREIDDMLVDAVLADCVNDHPDGLQILFPTPFQDTLGPIQINQMALDRYARLNPPPDMENTSLAHQAWFAWIASSHAQTDSGRTRLLKEAASALAGIRNSSLASRIRLEFLEEASPAQRVEFERLSAPKSIWSGVPWGRISIILALIAVPAAAIGVFMNVTKERHQAIQPAATTPTEDSSPPLQDPVPSAPSTEETVPSFPLASFDCFGVEVLPPLKARDRHEIRSINSEFKNYEIIEKKLDPAAESRLIQAVAEAERENSISSQLAKLSEVANLYLDHDEFEKSRAQFNKLLNLLNLLPEKHDMEKNACLEGLGKSCLGTEEYQDAILALKPVYDTRLTVLGEDHPDTDAVAESLAYAHFHSEDFKQAEILFRQVLSHREQKSDVPPLDIARSLDNVGKTLIAQEKYLDAEPFFTRAWTLRKQHCAPDHPFLAVSRNFLAMVSLAKADYYSAESHMEGARQIALRGLGDKSIVLATYDQNLANIFFHQKQWEKAARLAYQALLVRENYYGNDDTRTQESADLLKRAIERSNKMQSDQSQ